MNRKKRRHYEEEETITGINVTPLVDVCLVLVIIFMVTAPMFLDPVFKVNLPKARTQEGQESEKITVSVSADGKIAVESREIPGAGSFSSELKAELIKRSEPFVVFKADRDAYHGLLVDLMLKAKEAGATALTVAAEKKIE